MDYLVLGALDGLVDLMPLREHVESMLPFPSTSSMLLVDVPAREGLPCFQAVLLTSVFCLTLTGILLLMCRLCPISEFVLILDMNSISAHTESLQQHRNSLRKVKVKAFGDFDESDLVPLFQELAQLPKLQVFSVDLRIPFSLISTVVEGAQNLEELSLQFQLRQDGSDGDIQELAQSIRSHKCLTSVTVESSYYDPELDRNLDPLLEALGKLPTLRTLSLYNLKCSASAFSRVFQCSYLKVLEMSNVSKFTPELIDTLQQNTSLQTLVAPLHRGTETSWGDMVKHSNTLQKLMLVIEDNSGDNLKSENDIFLPIIKALQTNHSLLSLTFDVNENLAAPSHETALGPSVLCMESLANSLASNNTLTTLRIGHCSEHLRNNENLIEALVEAVKENYTLGCFEMRTGSCCSRRLDVPEIEFFLKSNRMGRGEILRSLKFSSMQKIPEYIIQNRRDVSMVYHLLLEKPEVIQNVDARKL